MSKFRYLNQRLVKFGRQRPKLLAISGFFILLGLVAGSLLLRPEVHAAPSANIVILSDNHVERTIPTTAKTVGDLLNELGDKINQGDVVEPTVSTKIDQTQFRINIYRAVPVEILDGTHRTYTFSAAASPRAVAEQAGITVYPEDNLTEGPVTNYADSNAIGEEITIDRATPINLMLYGNSSIVRTHTKTVGDLVSQENIKLASGDTLTPAANTPLEGGMTVAVNHQGIQYATVTESIPAPVSYVSDSSLTLGTGAIRQQGSAGQQTVTYEIQTENGREVSRHAGQTVVTIQPVTEIIARGTAIGGNVSAVHAQWMSEAGISSSDQGYADYIISHESGWNPASLNSGGCAGLGQACPGSKLAAVCPDWQIDPVCQLGFFNSYAVRKGGWYQSYLFKVAKGWW